MSGGAVTTAAPGTSPATAGPDSAMAGEAGQDTGRRERILRFEPGFYVLRNVARTACEGVEGLVSAVADDGGEAELLGTCVSAETRQMRLSHPGDMAVARIGTAGGRLRLVVSLPTADAGAGFQLHIDRLSQRVATGPVADGRPVLKGHVQRKGDVRAGADGWLGHPGSRDRLEGFSIDGAPGLRYGCRAMDGTEAGGQDGGFVGSRRKAQPLAAVWVALADGEADHRLRVEAAFAQSGTVVSEDGTPLEGEGPADHLVGLRVTFATAADPGGGDPGGLTVPDRKVQTFLNVGGRDLDGISD